METSTSKPMREGVDLCPWSTLGRSCIIQRISKCAGAFVVHLRGRCWRSLYLSSAGHKTEKGVPSEHVLNVAVPR